MRPQDNQGERTHTEPPRPLQGLGFFSKSEKLDGVSNPSLSVLFLITGSPCIGTSKLGTFKDMKAHAHASGTREPAACPPSLRLLLVLQRYCLPPSPSSCRISSCLSARCQPRDASCGTLLLYLSRCSTVRFKMFHFFVFVFHARITYGKSYKPITAQGTI